MLLGQVENPFETWKGPNANFPHASSKVKAPCTRISRLFIYQASVAKSSTW